MNEILILPPTSLNEKGLTVQKRIRNYDYPMHMHSFFEIEYIFSGQGTMFVNGTNYEITDNTLFFLTSMDIQAVHVTKPINFINISFSDSWIAEDVRSLIETNIIISDFKSEFFEMLYTEFKKPQILNYRYIKNLLNCLLIQIFRSANNNADNNNNDNNAIYIRKTLQYIHLHFRTQITIELLANQINLSPNYLCTVFHKTTGKTIFEYLTDFRLGFATKLLIYTDQSLTEICFNSGFNSYSHFMRTFKSKYNCTPKQFRKENASNTLKFNKSLYPLAYYDEPENIY